MTASSCLLTSSTLAWLMWTACVLAWARDRHVITCDMWALGVRVAASFPARLSYMQLMESAGLTNEQKAELLRQRQEYLREVAQLATARAPYEVNRGKQSW